jgi:hypothetical protein
VGGLASLAGPASAYGVIPQDCTNQQNTAYPKDPLDPQGKDAPPSQPIHAFCASR